MFDDPKRKNQNQSDQYDTNTDQGVAGGQATEDTDDTMTQDFVEEDDTSSEE